MRSEPSMLHFARIGEVPESPWPAGKLMQKLKDYDHEASRVWSGSEALDTLGNDSSIWGCRCWRWVRGSGQIGPDSTGEIL